MELRHVRYFIAVAEELSFTKAAKRLHIAQPPLSRQIQQLEQEIGVRLLERGAGSVFLTDAGHVFLEGARNVIAQSEQAVENARRAHDGKFGLVRVGIAWGLGNIVSRVLAEHSKRFPNVDVECRNIASGAQNEALRLRSIDVGFLRPNIDTAHLNSRALFSQPFTVVVSKANPLAKFRSLKLIQLANEPLLMIQRSLSSGTFDKTLDLYHRAGIHPRLIQTKTLPYEEAGAILVASGKGVYVAVGDDPVHPSFQDRVKAIPLDEPDACIDVHVGWRQHESSPAVLAFLETVNADLLIKKIRKVSCEMTRRRSSGF